MPYKTVLLPTGSSSKPPSIPPTFAKAKASVPCTLFKPSIASEYRTQPLPHAIFNEKNRYDLCFKGEFCRCGRHYDPLTETESMIQCLACEDWYHETCLNLKDPSTANQADEPEAPKLRASTPAPQPKESSGGASISSGDAKVPARGGSFRAGDKGKEAPKPEGEDPDDDDEEDDDSPILSIRDYDCFICATCVMKHDVLRNAAGTDGFQMIVSDVDEVPAGGGEANEKGKEGKWEDGWSILGVPEGRTGSSGTEEQAEGQDETIHCSATTLDGPVATGQKRKADHEQPDVASEAKKPRLNVGPNSLENGCEAPRPEPEAQAILKGLPATGSGIHALKGGKGDLFLADGVREALCVCSKCEAGVKALPFPLKEEAIWEPPIEAYPGDVIGSIADLSDKILKTLPPSQAIEAAYKLKAMKDKLGEFLLGLRNRDGDTVVTEADVQGFVQGIQQGSI